MKKDYINSLKNKKCLVIGRGKTGISVVKLLNQHSINYRIYDEGMKDHELTNKALISKKDIELEIGSFELLVTSPGMQVDAPILQLAMKHHIPIVTDLDIFYSIYIGHITSVTGSNGKSTTLKLIQFLDLKKGIKTLLGGNYGIPALELPYDFSGGAVIEISSFQAEFLSTFNAEISVLLNIYDNHLDRHKTKQEYIDLKRKIFLRSKRGIYFYDDRTVRDIGSEHPNAVAFSISENIENGYFIKNQNEQISIFYNKNLVQLIDRNSKIKDHDLVNLLAAFIVSHEKNQLLLPKNCLQDWHPLNYRYQEIFTSSKLTVINDSKSTNLEATIAALNATSGPIVLMIGGKSKGQDFNSLIPLREKEIIKIIAFGSTSEEIKQKLGKYFEIHVANTLNNAVENAVINLEAHYTILFSPGCPSQDMFKDFEERGENFKDLILEKVA